MRSLTWRIWIIAILQMEKEQTNQKMTQAWLHSNSMAGLKSGTQGFCAEIQESNELNFQ